MAHALNDVFEVIAVQAPACAHDWAVCSPLAQLMCQNRGLIRMLQIDELQKVAVDRQRAPCPIFWQQRRRDNALGGQYPNRKIEAFPTQEAYGLVAFTNDQSTLHGHNMQTLNPGFEMALH